VIPTHATTPITSNPQRPRRVAAVVPAFLFLLSALPLPAQIPPNERLTQAYALEREGKPAAAIPQLQQLLSARLLDDAGTATAWNILANAYQDEEDFANARHAYERSVQIYETTIPNKLDGRAAALDDFGQLYVSTQQFDVATRLETEALQLYEQVGDHAGIVRAASHLAGTAFSQGNVTRGSKLLKRAAKEAKLANNLDDDDRAAIESLKGWQAQLNHDVEASISNYGRALTLAEERHGEEHPATGWSYVLLGNADAAAGEWTDAIESMRKGLAILDRTMGAQSEHSLIAEIAYSRALDGAGLHAEAAKIKAQAEPLLKSVARGQCDGCTVTAAALH
jgi:tetratricopeptide (TPR) repeat protein